MGLIFITQAYSLNKLVRGHAQKGALSPSQPTAAIALSYTPKLWLSSWRLRTFYTEQCTSACLWQVAGMMLNKLINSDNVCTLC